MKSRATCTEERHENIIKRQIWVALNDQPVEFCSQLSNIPPLPLGNDTVNNSQTL